VVLVSIPEAKEALADHPMVRVPLAHLVPQLAQPTIWLTWETAILHSHNEGIHADANAFHGRWIRIPARHFVMQVPPEYFGRAEAPLHWMTLTAVEQEVLFTKEMAGVR
jgi:hypothetical protein